MLLFRCGDYGENIGLTFNFISVKNIMKYIIFEDDKTGLRKPVIFGDHTAHSEIRVKRAHPVSAGFFLIDETGLVSTFGDAKSIGLQPADVDSNLIFYVIKNLGTMFFLNYDKI